MTLAQIDIGTTANDGTGDTLREAGIKINDNFNALAQVTDADFKIALASFLMPIGYIVRLNVATNPAILYGFGTWTLHGEGRVGVCIDPTQTEFDTLGKTGGAKTHTLTTSEMPSHNHAQTGKYTSNGTHTHSNGGGGAAEAPNPSGGTASAMGNTANSGSGQAHNNLQPYIVEYVWVRTA